MKVTQARFNHLEVELGKRNLIISTLNEQNTALQATNTKLVLEKRRLVTDCQAYRHAHEDFMDTFEAKDKRIAELEQDGKRLDKLADLAAGSNWVTIVTLDSGKVYVTARYQRSEHTTTPKITKGKTLRQAIDEAMAKERGDK